MRDIDDTDREILRLLLEDARRPYADIAERVDLSPPAVSDRVDRLEELGVVQRFTLDLDRSKLQDGVDVLVELDAEPGRTTDVRESLSELEGVEHVFETADGGVVATATVPDERVREHFSSALDGVSDLSVRLLADADWHPALRDATLGLTCAECGNTVTSEGVSASVGGDRYEFCCPSCRSQFEERYERMARGSES